VATAVILTIGNELVSGDVPNTNGSWIAKRLEALGVHVELIASVPDVVEAIAEFVRTYSARADVLLVTGGLGGTPDDITREALAAAFGVEQVRQDDVAERLRSSFRRDPEYAARWAELPAGARALDSPRGGAPGFVIGNVYVMPGLPSEMEAMFDTFAEELRSGTPIASWRQTYRTNESRIADVLREAGERHPRVVVGSYPSFDAEGSQVEVVAKSADAAALAAAAEWLGQALGDATAGP
jgi:nicotinamide-nucleotide amidase